MWHDAAQRKFNMLLFLALDRFSREGVLETLKYLERLKSSASTGARTWSSISMPVACSVTRCSRSSLPSQSRNACESANAPAPGSTAPAERAHGPGDRSADRVWCSAAIRSGNCARKGFHGLVSPQTARWLKRTNDPSHPIPAFPLSATQACDPVPSHSCDLSGLPASSTSALSLPEVRSAVVTANCSCASLVLPVISHRPACEKLRSETTKAPWLGRRAAKISIHAHEPVPPMSARSAPGLETHVMKMKFRTPNQNRIGENILQSRDSRNPDF